MADSTIVNMPTASALAAPDWIPVVQGGVNKKSALSLIPVSIAEQAALNLKADLAAPALTGVPTAPTASAGTNTTQLATTAFVLANASLASDATKANINSPTFTGVPAAPTAANGTNTTQLATTAFVLANASLASDPLKANIASPTFTGVPAASTASAGTSTTQLATTAFATTANNLKANIASPTFTGVPAAPTAAPGTATTQLATAAFVDAAKRIVPSSVKTASYTLALVDAGTMVRMNVATANTLTVPPNISVAFPLDTVILPGQYGAGTTTIVAGAGVTLRARGGLLVLNGQYAVASLQKIGTDEWLVAGDLLESAPPPAATYGPELWPQPLFDASTNLTLDANWSIAAGVATSNGGAGFITATTQPLTIGITYRAEVVVSSYTGGTVWTPYDGTGSGQATFAAAAGTFTKEFVAASTGLMIYSDLLTGSITSASLKAVL